MDKLFTLKEREKQIKWVHDLIYPYLSEIRLWQPNYSSTSPHTFNFMNGWFGPFDAEVYYSIIRKFQPKTILEIGCGNTTKLAWTAGQKNSIHPSIIGIDPHPWGAESDVIKRYATRFFNGYFEEFDFENICKLKADDIFFMDSSHTIMEQDVQTEYDIIWNKLPSGVLIHWHDIHLPFNYCHEYRNRGYTDQYALMSLILSRKFEMLSANYWLLETQREPLLEVLPSIQWLITNTQDHFPMCGSFWMRKL